MGPLRPQQASDRVTGYLARGEDVVLEVKQHWARVLPAILSCVTGLALVIVAGICAPAWMGPLTNAAWWIWLVLLVHLVWRVLEWWDETFVITNKRLILVHGLFVKKVAMMPLSKVTDMSYSRSPAARLLGYGTFKIESAGQEQALNIIDFVRNPDATYRDVCGLIFGFEDDEDVVFSGSRDDVPWQDQDDAVRDADLPFDAADVWDDFSSEHDGVNGPVGASDAGALDDERTRPLTARSPRAHYGRGHRSRAIDDTDPHGFITVGRAGPHGDADHTYGQFHDMDEALPREGSESAWWVSREHATSPQTVHRRNRDHDVDAASTWRDGT